MVASEEMRKNFNQMTLVQKKEFITNVRKTVESSDDLVDKQFLSDCIRQFNNELAQAKQSPNSAAASAPTPKAAPKAPRTMQTSPTIASPRAQIGTSDKELVALSGAVQELSNLVESIPREIDSLVYAVKELASVAKTVRSVAISLPAVESQQSTASSAALVTAKSGSAAGAVSSNNIRASKAKKVNSSGSKSASKGKGKKLVAAVVGIFIIAGVVASLFVFDIIDIGGGNPLASILGGRNGNESVLSTSPSDIGSAPSQPADIDYDYSVETSPTEDGVELDSDEQDILSIVRFEFINTVIFINDVQDEWLYHHSFDDDFEDWVLRFLHFYDRIGSMRENFEYTSERISHSSRIPSNYVHAHNISSGTVTNIYDAMTFIGLGLLDGNEELFWDAIEVFTRMLPGSELLLEAAFEYSWGS